MRFKQLGKWCGWSQTKDCSTGEDTQGVFFTTGETYSQSGYNLTGMSYFNGCGMGGECYTKGIEGIGFNNHKSWVPTSSSYQGYGVTRYHFFSVLVLPFV